MTLHDLFPSFVDEMQKLALGAVSGVDGRMNGMAGIPRPKAPTKVSVQPLANRINRLNQVGAPKTAPSIGVSSVKL